MTSAKAAPRTGGLAAGVDDDARHGTAIAIVGMAALMPRARTTAEFWTNIVDATDCIEEVPPSRWSVADYYDPDPATTDRTYCRRGGFVPDIELDPAAFGLPPRSLEHIDSAQLLALVVARDALADAGFGPDRELPSPRTGVVLGVAGTTMQLLRPLTSRLDHPLWQRVLRAAGLDEDAVADVLRRLRAAHTPWDEDAFPGFLANVVAGRIASRLDLGGLSCAVDAACASSLCAIRVAASELQAGRCDVMLAGGVDTDNSIAAFMSFSKTPALSASEQVRPFSAAADGTLICEGVGMVVLKRLTDARRDGDRIYAAIRGIGASSDGRLRSIYAPRAAGQARALTAAYEEAGVSPASVGLVEAHGTGTRIGDAVEFEALRDVFAGAGAPVGAIALGSVKSQIGHAKAAAGIASLIKVALAIHQRVVPPTLHVEEPDPALGIGASPFHLSTQTRPWMRPRAAPRRAGVSAFGFGGTNYHVVLEDVGDDAEWTRMHAVARPVLVSADTPQLLTRRCRELADCLRDPARAVGMLAELTARADEDIPASAARVGFVAADADDAVLRLDAAAGAIDARPDAAAWRHPRRIFYRAGAADGVERVAALFPGQGSQYVGMGTRLALAFPELRQTFERFDERFERAGLPRVSSAVWPSSAEAAAGEDPAELLRDTRFAQAGVGAFGMAAYGLLAQAGLRPQLALGHSFGELTALWAAGSVDDDDYVSLVLARGQALTPTTGHDAGGMLAVATTHAAVRSLDGALAGMSIANVNAPRQVVLAGPSASLDEAMVVLAAAGVAAERLPVAAGFHSSRVAFARVPWAAALRSWSPATAAIPVLSAATATLYPDGADAIRRVLAEQPFEAVLFHASVERAYELGCRTFVEIGPRAVLTRLVEEILGDRPHVAVAVNPSRGGDADTQLREAVVQLRVAGLELGALDRHAAPIANTVEAPRLGVSVGPYPYVAPETRRAITRALEPPVASGPAALESGAGSCPAAAAGESPARADPRAGEPADASLAARAHELSLATIDAHRQYLAAQSERAALLLDLARAGDQPQLAALAALEEQEAQVLRVHEQYLHAQMAVAERLVEVAAGGPVDRRAEGRSHVGAEGPSDERTTEPRAAHASLQPHADSAAQAHRPGSGEPVLALLLRVVSEKTGYPIDVMEPDMELEADLGIDSIKRVEIFADVQRRLELRLAREEHADLRTLTQVASMLERRIAAPAGAGAGSDCAVSDPGDAVAPSSNGAARAGPDADAGAAAAARASQPPQQHVMRVAPLAAPGPAVALAGKVVLVTSDGTALTGNIVERLRWHGLTPVVIALAPELVGARPELAEDVHHVLLASADETQITAALARIASSFGQIGAFVHLHPPHDAAGARAHRAILRHVMSWAKHLGPHLVRDQPDGRRAFVTACRLDGAMGTARERPVEPLLGGLSGLVKTLRHEWPGVHTRAVDLGVEHGSVAADRVIAELLDGDGGPVEVGYAGTGRVTLVQQPRPAAIGAPATRAAALSAADVVLVTGGARGITAACVLALARRVRCGFVLVGRTPYAEPEPGWASGCRDEDLQAAAAAWLRASATRTTPAIVREAVAAVRRRREVAATLAALTSAGVPARYLQVDVSDESALRAALASVDLGPPTALLHGAGAIADRRIEDKTDDDFELVFAPKVDGLANVLRCVELASLRACVLFSSTAASHGSPGQADYAMANAVLDTAAHELARSHPACRTVAFAWCPWGRRNGDAGPARALRAPRDRHDRSRRRGRARRGRGSKARVTTRGSSSWGPRPH